MKKFSTLPLIFISSVALAQTTAPAQPKKITPTSNAAPMTIQTPAATVAAPAPTPNPWKLSYFGEYVGPRFSNFDLGKTQAPTDTSAKYTSIAHGIKIGYSVASDVVLGTQIRASQPFNPAKNFALKNWRGYISWAHMIDTNDVDMKTVVDVELPTSTGAKADGMIVAFNIKNNWTFKTSLRNWSFTAMTLIRPMFYNTLTTNTSDLYFGIFPWFQYDFAADWAFIFEGSFDASHSYYDTYFNFGQDDPDYMNFGVQYAFNSNIQINPAIRFYTADFAQPILYLSLSASL